MWIQVSSLLCCSLTLYGKEKNGSRNSTPKLGCFEYGPWCSAILTWFCISSWFSYPKWFDKTRANREPCKCFKQNSLMFFSFSPGKWHCSTSKKNSSWRTAPLSAGKSIKFSEDMSGNYPWHIYKCISITIHILFSGLSLFTLYTNSLNKFSVSVCVSLSLCLCLRTQMLRTCTPKG